MMHRPSGFKLKLMELRRGIVKVFAMFFSGMSEQLCAIADYSYAHRDQECSNARGEGIASILCDVRDLGLDVFQLEAGGAPDLSVSACPLYARVNSSV